MFFYMYLVAYFIGAIFTQSSMTVMLHLASAKETAISIIFKKEENTRPKSFRDETIDRSQ